MSKRTYFCPVGHRYTPENTGFSSSGKHCKECRRIKAQIRRDEENMSKKQDLQKSIGARKTDPGVIAIMEANTFDKLRQAAQIIFDHEASSKERQLYYTAYMLRQHELNEQARWEPWDQTFSIKARENHPEEEPAQPGTIAWY